MSKVSFTTDHKLLPNYHGVSYVLLGELYFKIIAYVNDVCVRLHLEVLNMQLISQLVIRLIREPLFELLDDFNPCCFIW